MGWAKYQNSRNPEYIGIGLHEIHVEFEVQIYFPYKIHSKY